MGIPSYFSYIIKNYSNIIRNIQHHKNNGTMFDSLFMDCNSIIYDIYNGIKSNKYESVFLLDPQSLTFPRTCSVMSYIIPAVWPNYENYAKKFSILSTIKKQGIISARIQKTEIGGGYHVWHCEST